MGMSTAMSIDGEIKNIIPLAILPPHLCDGYVFDQGYSQIVYMEVDGSEYRVAATTAHNMSMVSDRDQDHSQNRKSIEI